MRRLSFAEAATIAAVAAVPATVAGGALVIAQLEFATPHVDIWSNVWVKVAVGLFCCGLLVALFFSALAFRALRSRNANAAEPDGDAGSHEKTGGQPVTTLGERVGETRRHAGGPSLPDGPVSPHPRPDAGTLLIAERLELALASGGIRSIRVTDGGQGDRVQLALPAEEMIVDYRRALRATATLSRLPDNVKPLDELVRPLQKLLLQAVPDQARRAMAAEGATTARKLVSIELMLTDSRLERYPWELIADPTALCVGTTGVTVWRSVLNPDDAPVRKRWTSNLLLTGTASGREEEDQIKSELSNCGQVRVFDCPGIPSSFQPLLAQHTPAAFHLAAHADGTEQGPTLEELKINADCLGDDLGQHSTWAAVFSCRDSAAVTSSGNRPPAYKIAQRSGAAVVGMAGPAQPVVGGLFAAAFYRCLAHGLPAVRAYHEAVCAIRDHDIYSTMWSIPVMYARESNVIPFPADDQVRVRLDLEQARFHLSVLDRELRWLAREDFDNPGEWSENTATPQVRTNCITEYLAAAAASPAATAEERHRQGRINAAQGSFRSVLSAAARSLGRLGGAGVDERQEVLEELPLYMDQFQHLLRTLDDLIEQLR